MIFQEENEGLVVLLKLNCLLRERTLLFCCSVDITQDSRHNKKFGELLKIRTDGNFALKILSERDLNP